MFSTVIVIHKRSDIFVQSIPHLSIFCCIFYTKLPAFFRLDQVPVKDVPALCRYQTSVVNDITKTARFEHRWKYKKQIYISYLKAFNCIYTVLILL